MTDETGSRPPVPQRLSTVLLEVVSVVFAVLVALGINEWWEERENLEQAREATGSIAREIRRNRSQLLGDDSGSAGMDRMPALDSAIAAYRRGDEPSEVGVNWQVALLSSAAWETAQITGATRDMPLDRVIELAQLYEFQRYFSRSQDELTTLISDMGARMESRPLEVLVQVRSHFGTTQALRRTLATVYACNLVRLEGASAVEAGACPESDGPG